MKKLYINFNLFYLFLFFYGLFFIVLGIFIVSYYQIATEVDLQTVALQQKEVTVQGLYLKNRELVEQLNALQATNLKSSQYIIPKKTAISLTEMLCNPKFLFVSTTLLFMFFFSGSPSSLVKLFGMFTTIKAKNLESVDSLGNEIIIKISEQNIITEMLIKPAGMANFLPVSQYIRQLQSSVISSESIASVVTDLVTSSTNPVAADALNTAIAFSGSLPFTGLNSALLLMAAQAAPHVLPRSDSLQSLLSIGSLPTINSLDTLSTLISSSSSDTLGSALDSFSKHK